MSDASTSMLLIGVIVLALAGGTACGEAVRSDGATKPPAATSVDSTESQSATMSNQVGSIFHDVTDRAGVGFRHHEFASELFPMGAGVVVFDFDNDGFQDIYIPDSDGANALYRNSGDGSFTETAAAAGVDDPAERGNGGCAADYDNDGDFDLYVTNYGSSKLFSNNGAGTFVEVTGAAGLGHPGYTYRSAGCAWGDYDRDGYLDLVVVRHVLEGQLQRMLTNQDVVMVGGLVLYHNNRDGAFSDVTHLLADSTGPKMGRFHVSRGNVWGAGFQPSWADFDNDGDVDLYVVNDMGSSVQPNVLWRNDGRSSNGSWSFLDSSAVSGANQRMDGMGLAVADYDGDGFLDVYMTNIGDNVLLRNTGDGLGFANTTAQAGVGLVTIGRKLRVTWGAVFFDYDNDGDEDLYAASGYLKVRPLPGNPVLQPNVLMRNNGDGTFTDVSSISGADDPGVGRGVAYLDYDNDGCLDLFVANLGQTATLLRNACDFGNNWLGVRTVGNVSNRDGIGARITVVSGGSTQIRQVSSGSSQMGQNALDAHFGLGRADAVDFVVIKWPSGKVQTLANVEVNQKVTVTEPGG